MANTIILDDLSFDQKVSRASRPVLIDFWAEWCRPCRSIAPVLEELAQEYSGKVDVAKVNVDDFPRIAAGLGVRSIPTMVVFSRGVERERLVGSYSKSEIKKRIESVL
jgi:thioredoxin 1